VRLRTGLKANRLFFRRGELPSALAPENSVRRPGEIEMRPDALTFVRYTYYSDAAWFYVFGGIITFVRPVIDGITARA